MQKINLFLLRTYLFLFLMGSFLNSYGQLRIEANLNNRVDGSLQNNEFGFLPTTHPLEEQDSLFFKRGFLSGKMMQKKVALKNKAVIELFKSDKKLVSKYRIGRILRPLGTATTLGGIALGYLAIRGKPASALVEGENFNYTVRSMPILLAGIGAIAGGICLIEFSNELVSSTADNYNAKFGNKKITLHDIKIGISPAGNIGLFAKF